AARGGPGADVVDAGQLGAVLDFGDAGFASFPAHGGGETFAGHALAVDGVVEPEVFESAGESLPGVHELVVGGHGHLAGVGCIWRYAASWPPSVEFRKNHAETRRAPERGSAPARGFTSWGALKGSGDPLCRLLAALVHQLLEVGAGTELRYPRLGHLDERASGRVPRRTRRLVHHLERTEADDRHLVAGGHRLLHRLDDRVDRL